MPLPFDIIDYFNQLINYYYYIALYKQLLLIIL